MANALLTEDRTGAIAGVEIVHRLETGIALAEVAVPWPQADPTDRPIVIDHRVGELSLQGMVRVMDVGDRLSYYRAADGAFAIRIEDIEPGGPAQVIREIEPGFRYSATYAFAPRGPAFRRDIEISVFTQALAVRRTRYMAHGCGLLLPDDSAAICLGKSGAGKTTASRLLAASDAARVLNDDRLIIERRGDNFHLWGTPWPGNAGVARAGDGSLAKIALIGRGPEHATRRLTAREAVPLLLPTLALPIWDSRLMDAALAFVGALVDQVDIVELRYPLEDRTGDWMVDVLGGTLK